MITFIDREQEQAFLQTLTAEASAHFVMVYRLVTPSQKMVGKPRVPIESQLFMQFQSGIFDNKGVQRV